MVLWWIGAIVLLVVVLPVVIALLNRVLAALERIRAASDDILRGGGLGAVQRLAPVQPRDAVLQVGGEVAHQHRGDVGDHAPAVLGGRAGDLQVLSHADLGAGPGPAQGGGNGHRGLATAAFVGAGRVDHHALARLVAFGDVGRAREPQPHRAHADADAAPVVAVAQVVGQLGTGQAGGDVRDVAEELPHSADRRGDLELVGDQHRLSSLSKAARQLAQQK